MTHDDDRRANEYGAARVAASLALIGVIVVMLLVDAFNVEYEPNPIIVTTVLGAAAALLGVEVVAFIQRRGNN